MERRASDRVSTQIATTCRVPATAHRATILDLSYHGCRVKIGDAGIQVGATIHFELGPRSRISGQVVRSEVGSVGVHFHAPLRSDEAIQLGLEQPVIVQIESEPEPVERDSLPVSLRHWVRRLCGLAT